MTASDMFRLSESVRGEDYLLATYYIEMPAEADILAKAAGYAVGQTIGTWVEVPGVTAEMRDRAQGRVVRVLEAPPVDLGTQAGETSGYFMTIALPTVNFGPSVLAGDVGLDLYRVDLSQVVSKYIGETEKNLSRVFDEAQAGNAVLLFDEADALFGKRSEVSDAAFLAAADGGAIRPEHLLKGLRREFDKVGRVWSASEP